MFHMGQRTFMVEIHLYHLIRWTRVQEVTIDVLSHASLATFMLFSSCTVKHWVNQASSVQNNLCD